MTDLPHRLTPIIDPSDDVLGHTHALASDLRQWLEWAALTGAVEVPMSDLAPASRGQGPSLMTRPPAADPRSPAPGHRPIAPASPAGPSASGSAPAAFNSPPASAPRTMASRPASTPVPRVSPRAASASTAPPPPTGDVARHDAGLTQVRAELGDCQRCRLSKDRKNIVYGVGNPQADLVLIGEAPGKDEDLTGEPFVGRSGQLLTRMLAAIGFERDQVYICNVIKCRPPQNRDPLSDEIATCSPFLHRQVAAIGPKAILTLGRFAAMNLVGEDLPMGELRKRLGSVNGIPVVPTYHPSYLLRSPAMKRLAWEDLLRVRQLLRASTSPT